MAYKPYGVHIFYWKGSNMTKWFKTSAEQDECYRKYKARVKLPPKASGRDVKYCKKVSK